MIDIDKLEKSIEFRRQLGAFDGDSQIIINLIAEIRRLQSILSDYNGTEKEQLMARVEKLERENRALGKMLGERKGHRKCPCGGEPEVMKWKHGRRSIKCDICDCSTDYCDTPEEAWAAWDGVE